MKEKTLSSEDLYLINACRDINKNLKITNRIEAVISEPLSESERVYLSLYFEMYRNLSLLFGDDKLQREWLFTFNTTLKGYPSHLILSTISLRAVNEFLAVSLDR